MCKQMFSIIILAEEHTWKTTLDFSRRYVLMFAPMMSPFLPKPISMYFPKRLLLSFRVVLAFPIDCRHKHRLFASWKRSRTDSKNSYSSVTSITSIIGLEARTLSSTLVCCAAPPTTAKYLMVNLAETVFPEPDSPLMMIDWFFSSLYTQTDCQTSYSEVETRQFCIGNIHIDFFSV